LPFANETGNADAEYLSDGMTETLISSLSNLPNLDVKARSSVFRYKGRETNANTIADELNVQAFLIGKVRQRGNELSLYIELVEARTEKAIWSQTYNRPLMNVVTLQSEIARDVADKLKTKLSGADERKLTKNYTENPEAYRLYLQGRFHWNKRKTEDFHKAIGFYEQAIAVDPNYALAYAGIADAYAYLADYRSLPPRETMPKAKEAALKAVALDDQLAEAHAALGHILCDYDHNFVEAEARYKRAIELTPNYATAHLYYAELQTWLGRFAEAEAEYQRALELEPFSLGVNWLYAFNLYHMRRYDESIAQARKLLEMYPDFAWGHTIIAFNHRMKGNYAGCVEEIAKSHELFERPEQAAFVRESFAQGGWNGYLRAMTGEHSPHNETSLIKATNYAALGEKDKAFAQLEKLYDYRTWGLITLKVEPALDPLRDDPRFLDLLRRVGFNRRL
jgi:TolB-like protein/Flp pilus assembly protein TadD